MKKKLGCVIVHPEGHVGVKVINTFKVLPSEKF
jgi:hypothetical protein